MTLCYRAEWHHESKFKEHKLNFHLEKVGLTNVILALSPHFVTLQYCLRVCVRRRPHVQPHVQQQLPVDSVQRSQSTELLCSWEGQRQGSEQQTLEITPPASSVNHTHIPKQTYLQHRVFLFQVTFPPSVTVKKHTSSPSLQNDPPWNCCTVRGGQETPQLLYYLCFIQKFMSPSTFFYSRISSDNRCWIWILLRFCVFHLLKLHTPVESN